MPLGTADDAIDDVVGLRSSGPPSFVELGRRLQRFLAQAQVNRLMIASGEVSL